MNVGIWIRVSTEDQARGDSPKNHEHRARMYAELKHWNVIELYDLSGVSGKNVIEQPEAKRMLADITTGKIKALIFSKLARLARNTRDLLDISDHFQKHGANLVSLEESIDTSTPAGRLLFTVIGALAQWEREEISARVAASIPVRAKMGWNTGGKGPFGYHWKDKKLIPKDSEAMIVRVLFDTFIETKKLMTTAKILNEKGYRTQKGSLFDATAIKRYLTEPTYKGVKRANYSKSKGQKKSWVLKPEKDWVYYNVEPIIEQAKWDEANSLVQQIERRCSSAPPPQIGKYAFSGLLTCGTCKDQMYVMKYPTMKVPRYICRKCKEKINEDILIEKFKEGLQSMAVNPDQLQGGDDADKLAVQEKEAQTKQLVGELKAIGKKIDSIIELWNDKAIDKATFSEKFDELRVRKEQLQNEIPRIEGEIAFIKTAELGRDKLLTQATSLAALWDTLDYDGRVKVTRELLSGVTYRKDQLTFEYFYLPQFMEVGKPSHTVRGSWQQPASARQGT
jgi:site-specific DNA recombinase